MILLFSPRISVIAFLQQFHPIFPIHVSSFPFSCTFCFQYTSSFSRFTRIYLFPATKSFLLFVSYLSSFHLTHFIHLAFFLFSLLLFSFIRFVLLSMRPVYFHYVCKLYPFHCFIITNPLFLLRISLDSLTLYKASIRRSSCTCHLFSSPIVPQIIRDFYQ